MLRNSNYVIGDSTSIILNEVLSLNAQESVMSRNTVPSVQLLNEVLSLNAQESSNRLRPSFPLVCPQ